MDFKMNAEKNICVVRCAIPKTEVETKPTFSTLRFTIVVTTAHFAC